MGYRPHAVRVCRGIAHEHVEELAGLDDPAEPFEFFDVEHDELQDAVAAAREGIAGGGGGGAGTRAVRVPDSAGPGVRRHRGISVRHPRPDPRPGLATSLIMPCLLLSVGKYPVCGVLENEDQTMSKTSAAPNTQDEAEALVIEIHSLSVESRCGKWSSAIREARKIDPNRPKRAISV